MSGLRLKRSPTAEAEDGQTLVEYALILALVALVVLVALTTLKGAAGNTMGNVANEIGNAAP